MAERARVMDELDRERAQPMPPGLVLAAALAVPFVLYSYLGGLWLNQHGYSPRVLVAVREWVNRPLGVGEDFGVLALCVLLLVAGYAGAADRSPVRAAWSVGLPAVVAVGAAALGAPALVWPFAVVAVHAVLLLVTTPLRARPLIAVVVQLVVVAGGAVLVGAHDQEVVDKLAFAVLPIMGQALWLVRVKALTALTGGTLVVAGWALIAAVESRHPAWEGQWFPITVCYAVLVVLVALPSGELLGRHAFVRAVTARAAWIVALIGPVGLTVQDLLYPATPWLLIVLAGAAATAASAEILYRLPRPGGAR
ncbi:hypothetical protein [Actinokineospora fastidiosa]|uniref:Uncharacterized protein n=1 Tax=Actinokineospora fastidiosa TaxID=1816 RepID=A0A918G5M9_9PSEU|nr:hypothetical protein [Actinokineospora fastidiosa]GGS18578.1 hypothetical protein GCM10010171_08890 [Actinokineospora fastidiosa]